MGEAAVIWGRLTEAFWLNCQLFGWWCRSAP